MVEELKLAIKVDDDSLEQSLLKQFANAQKMADKVVLDFKNVNFDDTFGLPILFLYIIVPSGRIDILPSPYGSFGNFIC